MDFCLLLVFTAMTLKGLEGWSSDSLTWCRNLSERTSPPAFLLIYCIHDSELTTVPCFILSSQYYTEKKESIFPVQLSPERIMVSLAYLKLGQGKESFDFEGLWVLSQRQWISSESVSGGAPWAVPCIQDWCAWPWDTGEHGWPMVQDSLRVLGSQAGSSCSISCCTASPQHVGKAASQPQSAETGSPCSFQLQHSHKCGQVPLNAWAAAAKGRALSVTGNDAPCVTT